jgi:hypothetical protein
MKRIVSLVAMLAMVVFLVAPAALAQGPQGKVEQGPEHALSICSYSGLNDHDPEEPPGGLTQSYGQDVRQHDGQENGWRQVPLQDNRLGWHQVGQAKKREQDHGSNHGQRVGKHVGSPIVAFHSGFTVVPP